MYMLSGYNVYMCTDNVLYLAVECSYSSMTTGLGWKW